MRISRRRLPSSLIGRTLVQLSDIHVGPRWIHPEITNRIAAIAEAGGIRMLRNAVADVEGLQVVGLDDLWARRFDSATPLASLDRAR